MNVVDVARARKAFDAPGGMVRGGFMAASWHGRRAVGQGLGSSACDPGPSFPRRRESRPGSRGWVLDPRFRGMTSVWTKMATDDPIAAAYPTPLRSSRACRRAVLFFYGPRRRRALRQAQDERCFAGRCLETVQRACRPSPIRRPRRCRGAAKGVRLRSARAGGPVSRSGRAARCRASRSRCSVP